MSTLRPLSTQNSGSERSPTPLPPLSATLPGADPHVSLASSLNTPLWVTVAVPASCTAGRYTGAISLHAGVAGDAFATVQLAVNVRSFAIPSTAKASLLVDAGFNLGQAFMQPANVTRSPALVSAFYEQMAKHRVNRQVWQDALPSMGMSVDDDHVMLNTSAYDKTLSQMIENGLRQWRFPTPNAFDASLGQSTVSTETMKKPNKRHRYFDYCQNWTFVDKLDPMSSSVKPTIHNYRVFAAVDASNCQAPPPGKLALDPAFKAAFRAVYGAVAGHLRGRGWLDGAYAWFVDEPSWKGALVLGQGVASHKHPLAFCEYLLCTRMTLLGEYHF